MKNILALFFVSISFYCSGQALQKSCNCCTEDFLAFDFWVGKWKVKTPKGVLAGWSTISKEQGGCVVRESWKSAKKGFSGTSLNFFNSETGQWEQLWVDNSGANLKLKGIREDNRMVLSSDEFLKDGERFKNRITWTKNDDGTVRQLWEILKGDKVLSVAFDGLYEKESVE